MFKYILSIQLFLTSLFAHNEGAVHAHFFTNLHVEDFTLILIVFIAGFMLFKHFYKEAK